ncbi:MAG: CPBP family intramembrane glutamic endopeptidase [Candidatus Marinimicrobia bacterium]|nr:CPBP family intramembrane glutamic endopeptidase [Candidatus Neomarinimicrobiota bacterium]
MFQKNNKQNNKLKLTPELIWSKLGIYQEIILLGVILATYAISRFIYNLNPIKHHSIYEWHNRVFEIFNLQDVFSFLIKGILIGIMVSFIITILDIIISKLQNEAWYKNITRNDFILPKTVGQKKMAAIIIFSGSFVEEIIFRGLIFFALLPVWNSWIWAALIVSSIFAFFHADIQGFLSSVWIFFISMVLSFLIFKYQSIVIIYSTHVTMNLISIFLMPQLIEYFKNRMEN